MKIYIPDDQAEDLLATLEICVNTLPEDARSDHKERIEKLIKNIEASKAGAVFYDVKAKRAIVIVK